jgi:hypothetical protein
MKLYKRKNQESYIKLLVLFENELKRYHKIFDNENYTLNYIVSRDQCSDSVELKVTLSISKKPLWILFIYDPNILKSILESYCNYFSVKEVTIVRPFNFGGSNKTSSDINTAPPIEERVSFEFFRDSRSWRT